MKSVLCFPPYALMARFCVPVVMNLMINAVEAMPEGGRISVKTFALSDPAAICLEISDNGPGIMEQDQQRIFDPFFTRKPEGTGLGLSICRQILERHGAYIELDSSVGKGTTFRIIIPLTQNHADGREPLLDQEEPNRLQVEERISRHGLH